MLLSSPVADEVDLSKWKLIIGGSALPRGLAEAAAARGIDVFSGYGMSETGPVATISQVDLDQPQSESLDIVTKAGRSLPLVDLRVVDEHMNDVPRDGVSSGEVVMRTPWNTMGYFKNPEGSDELWRGGYLHTGDIGVMDSNGYLQITDRLKDVIKSGGEWISSVGLEDVVSRHSGVTEVAAIGVPDERWGERPMLLVVCVDGSNAPDAAEIKALVQTEVEAGNLSKWAVPDRVEFVESIAKTSVGKIDKKTLRATWSAEA